jgi:hypothetical protein
MRLSERLGSLVERQKADLQFYGGAGEQAPPGRFKVSAQIIKMLEKDAPDAWKDEMGRVDITQVLFAEQQKLLRAIPREDLPALVGADNIPDAQDVLANKPREAFKLMLRNIAKVSPRAAKLMRAVPENVALYWYLIMARLSGRDMADELFKKYFSTAQGGKAFGQAQKKFKAVAEGREGEGEDEGEGEAMDDEGVCPVTGEPRPCEARDRTDGAACEGCEGPEAEDDEEAEDEEDEGMDAEEASEAVGHWVRALVEAAAKKKQQKKASKGQQLSAKYINPKTGAFKGRKGERFGNCVKYMKAKGGISDPKALCGTIARKKAGSLGEAAGRRVFESSAATSKVIDALGGIDLLKSSIGASRFSEMAGSPGVEFYFMHKGKDAVASVFGVEKASGPRLYSIELRKTLTADPYAEKSDIALGSLRSAFEKMLGSKMEQRAFLNARLTEAAGERDRMDQARLAKLAQAALRPTTLLVQLLPGLVEERNAMTVAIGQDLYKAYQMIDRLHAALTAIAAGHAMREAQGDRP